MKYKIIIDDKTTMEGEIDGNLSKLTMESDEGYVCEYKNIKKDIDGNIRNRRENKRVGLKAEIERYL